jgi:hypothetical protein
MKNKTLIKIVAAILALIVAIHYINVYKRKLFKKLDSIENKIDYLQTRIMENNFVQTGYEVNNATNIEDDLNKTIFFIGHIYPKSGYIDSENIRFKNIEHPIKHLNRIAKKNMPFKFVFGGDNVFIPTSGALNFLIELKSKLKNVRFIPGNHDQYWRLHDKEPRMKALYPERYFFEDKSSVRLIYLHSVLENGKYGLDEEQVAFLRRSLKPSSSYNYAIIFLHHTLWAGGHSAFRLYDESARLIEQWKNEILPIFSEGRVKGVFSGDGGVETSGTFSLINEIPHYSTGWSIDRSEVPPEWLRIDLGEDEITVHWQKLSGGNLFVKLQEER